MNYVIILAGGEGSRFWPLSSSRRPKQFLSVCSDKAMLDTSIERMLPVAGRRRIYIATSRAHRKKASACLGRAGIPAGNMFFEPLRKNTLAPIAFLSKEIMGQDPDAVITVIPADHYIRAGAKFISLLKRAAGRASKGSIILLGVPPKRPETGYGYMKAVPEGKGFCRITRFVEKPDAARAQRFLAQGGYYWNAGIFVFRADVMLSEIRKYAPKAYAVLGRMRTRGQARRLWRLMPDISIDYAVMEKTKKAALLPAACGWVDVGSWGSLTELMKKDRAGNCRWGNCVDLGSAGSVVWSDAQLVATIGLKDIVVVSTKDAVLVCPKENVQDVKRLVQMLKHKKLLS